MNDAEALTTSTPAAPPPAMTAEEAAAANAPPGPLPTTTPMKVTVRPASVVAPAIAETPSAWSRGFVHTSLSQNPKGLGDALEMMGHLAPAELKPAFDSASRVMLETAKQSPVAYTPQSKGFRDTASRLFEDGSMDRVLQYLGETSGSALASSLPSMVAGGGLGLAGARLGGPRGGVIGATIGAFFPSAALNGGEVYDALKQAGVEPKRAAFIGAIATGPIALLDTASVAPIIKGLVSIGKSAVSAEAIPGIVKRMIVEMVKAAPREAVTETAQEAIKQGAVTYGSGKPFFSAENTNDLIESGAGGFFGGGSIGPLGGIARPQVRQQKATPGDIAGAHADLTGGAPLTGEVIPPAGGPPPGPPPGPRRGPALTDVTYSDMTGQRAIGAPTPTGELLRRWAQEAAAGDVPAAAQAILSLEPETGPVWYSGLKRVAEEKLPERASAAQIAATLRNASGVKLEEIEATGVLDFLNAQTGAVAKRDVIAHLEERQIRVETTSATQQATDAVSLPGSNYRMVLLASPTDAFASSRVADYQDEHGQPLLVAQDISPQTTTSTFTTSWAELAMKRLTRWAADGGHTRLAWVEGKAAAVQRQTPEQQQEVRKLHDVELPRAAQRVAKQLGGTVGTTRLASGQTVHYIEIPPRAATIVQQGLPMFSRQPGEVMPKVSVGPETMARLKQKGGGAAHAAVRIATVLQQMSRRFGIAVPIRIHLRDTIAAEPGSQTAGMVIPRVDGSYDLSVNVGFHKTAEHLYATAMHELGHILMNEKFKRADTMTQLMIHAAHERFVELNVRASTTLAQMQQRRDNVVAALRAMDRPATVPLYSLSPEDFKYWTGFDEWFAEQVATWATSEDRALNVVDRFFKGLGSGLRDVLGLGAQLFGLRGVQRSFKASPEMVEWLNSFMESGLNMGSSLYSALDHSTQRINQALIDGLEPGIVAGPRQASTQPMYSLFSNVFGGAVPVVQQQQLAMADKLGHIGKLTLGIYDIAERNPHIEPLARYIETLRLATREQADIQSAWMKTMEAWDGLGRHGADPLVGLLDDVTNMTYRTAQEVAQGIARHPTAGEFSALVAQHGVTREGLAVFKQINQRFDAMLTLMSQVAIDGTASITDPVARMDAIVRIQTSIAALRAKPYFPFMRFGDHYLIVKDAAGSIVHREHVERRGVKSAEAVQRTRKRQLEKVFPPTTHTVEPHVLDASSKALLGIPAAFLDAVAAKLQLTPAQVVAMEHLRFEVSPASSFKHRFQQKSYVKGYSLDFKRAFAQYGFMGSIWYKKAKYADQLRGSAADIRNSALMQSLTPVTREKIANHVYEHLEKNFLNPAGDLIKVKAAAVAWTLFGMPMSAAANLSQTPFVTAPFLSNKFGGPLRPTYGARLVLKHSTRLRNFYKKGQYTKIGAFETRAMEYAIRTGTVDNTFASELASWAQGSNLNIGYGGNITQRMLHEGMAKGMWMFEITEKVNRRVAFMAALEATQEHPASAYVQQTLPKYRDEIQRLIALGFTQAEANATVVAGHVTDSTQGRPGYEARPKMMRGKLGSLFLFQRFPQLLLFLNINHVRGFMPRFMLIMLGIVGLQGIPGYDDLEEVLRALAWRMFGKDFNLSREITRLIVDVTGSDVAAEVALHGVARMSFGMPWIADMIGEASGLWRPRGTDPKTGEHVSGLPSIDMSSSLGTGLIVPIEWGKIFGPPLDPIEKIIGQETAKGAGVMGSIAMNMLKATASKDDITEMKRLELIMPRMLREWSQSYRGFTEGGYTDARGARIVEVNPRDPEHIGELLAMAAGARPRILSKAWEVRRNAHEVDKFLDDERKHLLTQLYVANKGDRDTEYARVLVAIEEYNNNLPDWALAKNINKDTIKESLTGQIKSTTATETGIPRIKGQRGVAEEMQRLYGGTVVEERRVK